MRLTHRVWTLLAIVLVSGCSGSDDADVSEESDVVETALVSTQPVVSELEKSAGGPGETDEVRGPFAENLNLFTPPKMIIPFETDEDEFDLTGDLPPIRLVGFVGATGDKAMMTIEGNIHLVTAGERISGIEIVSVESPKVGLRWGETELMLDFYKPIKSNRTVRKVEPTFTFSPGLLDSEDSRNHHNTPAAPKAASYRQPHSGLQPLPTLPMPGDAPGNILPVVPNLGPETPPAP